MRVPQRGGLGQKIRRSVTLRFFPWILSRAVIPIRRRWCSQEPLMTARHISPTSLRISPWSALGFSPSPGSSHAGLYSPNPKWMCPTLFQAWHQAEADEGFLGLRNTVIPSSCDSGCTRSSCETCGGSSALIFLNSSINPLSMLWKLLPLVIVILVAEYNAASEGAQTLASDWLP